MFAAFAGIALVAAGCTSTVSGTKTASLSPSGTTEETVACTSGATRSWNELKDIVLTTPRSRSENDLFQQFPLPAHQFRRVFVPVAGKVPRIARLAMSVGSMPSFARGRYGAFAVQGNVFFRLPWDDGLGAQYFGVFFGGNPQRQPPRSDPGVGAGNLFRQKRFDGRFLAAAAAMSASFSCSRMKNGGRFAATASLRASAKVRAKRPVPGRPSTWLPLTRQTESMSTTGGCELSAISRAHDS